MPGMSGLDVAREIRLIRANLPVVIVSGFIDEALTVQAAGVGVSELIYKENISEELCATIFKLAQNAVVKPDKPAGRFASVN